MSVADNLPTMEDGALATLHANAARLLESGAPAQRSAAAALMPSIKEEMAARAAAQISIKAAALAAKRAAKAKPSAEAAA